MRGVGRFVCFVRVMPLLLLSDVVRYCFSIHLYVSIALKTYVDMIRFEKYATFVWLKNIKCRISEAIL